MGKNRIGRIVPILAVIGSALACSAPGGLTATPTFYEIFPGPTELTSTSTPLPGAVEAAPPPNQTAAADNPAIPSPSSAATPTAPSGLSAKVKEILDFYPLAKGASWTYQATFDMAGPPGSQDTIWNGPITATVGDAAIENGFPIFRLDWTGYPEVFAFEFASQYDVVRDAGIYQAATQDKASELAHSPVFTQTAVMGWPLAVGGQWGDPDMLAHHDGRYVWVVEATQTVKVPAGSFDVCYRTAFYTNGDTTFSWFCPGKGLVRYEYHHHGTTNDQVWELTSFKPGS